MNRFLDAATGYPTAILSVLLLVVVGYWVLAMMGWVDFDSGDVDIELQSQADVDAGELSTLAGYVMALGLNGVPFSVAVSLLVLLSWTVSCMAGEWLMPWVPTLPLQLLVGTGVLLASVGLGIVLTAQLIKPMRGLFVTHQAVGNASLVGQACKILSQSVDDRMGYAEVSQRGAGLQIRVWADAPNTLRKGVVAHILEYDEVRNRYLVQQAPPEDR
jgi:hypothetical protein